MYWQRLDRDNTVKVIDSVKSVAEAGLFSPATSEVERAGLPFYSGNIALYKITNFASLPSFTFEYLGDGLFFTYLDGTDEPIYTLNDKGLLTLNEGSVLEYLDFYFAHAMIEDEEMYFIRNVHDMPLLDSLDMDSAAEVTRNHRPATVAYDAGFDKYTVEADIYAEGLMLRATIEVTASGRVTITHRRMIVNAIANSFSSGIMV
jgi:hypothetical protein